MLADAPERAAFRCVGVLRGIKEAAGTGLVQAFQMITALMHTGVDRPSGLRWPHVAGTRNGAEFWYSCAVPRIVRDVISFCTALQDTLYRWPFVDNSLDLPTFERLPQR